MKSRILITGGCGKIGSYFAKYASEKYYVRVVDKVAWDIKKHGPLPGESLVFDLSYLDECRSACEGVDIVIHLAVDASQDAYFAYKEGLLCIVLRIGAYTFPGEYEHFSCDEMDAFLDPDDFNELLIRCIDIPDIEFAIAHAISDNRYKRLDLSQTREIFGYQPKTDAFTIFQKPKNGL